MSKSVPGSLTDQRPPPRRRRWSWMRPSPLGRDIAVILVLKLAALSLLWWAFFSHPTATHMRVEPSRIEARLLAPDPQEPSRADR